MTCEKTIPFAEELAHVECYLKIEKARFRENLNVIYSVKCQDFEVPPLSVQPLVENAVKHGIAKKRGGGVVTISSRQTETTYQITVSDTGVGFDVERYMEDGKVHVGLMNVRQRLHSIMNATVDVTSVPGNGTTVTVTIPKKKVSQ